MNFSSKTIGEAAFNEAYASLNAAQRQAVDAIDGPVMVIAGPGTGKTQILTLRIANILRQTDTRPENILALTFTESAARAMRERLRRYLGAAAYRVPIYTFHGFAGQLISSYPDAFPQIIGGQPVTDIEKIEMLETILADAHFKKLRPAGNPSYYVTPIMRIISELKQDSVKPDDLAKIIIRQEELLAATPQFHEKGAHKGKVRGEYHTLEASITKNKELLQAYRLYEAALRERQRYDFEDMLLSAVFALKHDEQMLRDLQETYHYLLADEHQDVNGAQNQLLELLAAYHDRPNIFTVGDEKQAIYRFQGASLENFLFFEEQFPETTTIALTANYRSGQSILDAAHSLVAVGDGPLKDLRVPLTAEVIKSAMVEWRSFSHQAIEDDFVVAEISRQLEAGVSPQEIAVIVRTNREVEYYAGALRAKGIPVHASAEGDILQHPVLITIELLMQVVAEPENETALFQLLHAPYWQLPTSDLVRLLSRRSREMPLRAILADPTYLVDCGVIDLKAVTHVHEVLEQARSKTTTQAPHQIVAFLIEASGLWDQLVQDTPLLSARVVRRLYDEIEQLVATSRAHTLTDVLREVALRREYNLALTAPFIDVDVMSVSVMTAHKAKGLEFSIVFLPHLVDTVWGGNSNRRSFDIPLTKLNFDQAEARLDDERRLLYVAMTRAKTHLFLSAATETSNGREMSPSRLISDIDPSLISTIDTSSTEAAFSMMNELRQGEKLEIKPTVLLELFKKRGFSATSINNYMDSPWQYIYRNLLRMPEIKTLPLLYGTAIHNVLQHLTKQHTATGKWLSDSEVTTRLRREITRLPLGTDDAVRLHEKGLVALVSYREHLMKTTSPRTREEFSLTVLFPTGVPEVPEIPLTGKLDRLDFDDEGRLLRVVDYKTGKAKSRNDIEGKTKTSRGHYKRQLVFYALLLSLYDDDRYQCREGVLSFVEPDKHGVIKEETFTITDDEIAELKGEITSAVQTILSGDFGVCDPELCDYCHLAERWVA